MSLAELNALLRLHDGDDRCRCLAVALFALAEGSTTVEDVAEQVRRCLETHPAGSSYYRRTSSDT